MSSIKAIYSLLSSFFVLFLLLMNLGCSTSSLDQPDWAELTIQKRGIGNQPYPATSNSKIMAERASKINALHELSKEIKKLPVTKSKKVEDYLPKNWKINNFNVESVEHLPDGSCVTEVSIPLDKVWNEVRVQHAKQN